MDKKKKLEEELVGLKRKISSIATLATAHTDSIKRYKKEIAELGAQKEALINKLTDLRVSILREKESLEDYKRKCLESIEQERREIVKAKKGLEETEAKANESISQAKVLEETLTSQRARLAQEKNQLEVLKGELETAKKEIIKREQSVISKEAEINISSSFNADRQRDLNDDEVSLKVREKDLEKKTEMYRRDKVSLDLRDDYLETKEKRLNRDKLEVEQEKIRLRKVRAQLDSKLETLGKETEEAIKQKEIYEHKLEGLKNYENELELKRLQLLKRAKDKSVQLELKKLKK